MSINDKYTHTHTQKISHSHTYSVCLFLSRTKIDMSINAPNHTHTLSLALSLFQTPVCKPFTANISINASQSSSIFVCSRALSSLLPLCSISSSSATNAACEAAVPCLSLCVHACVCLRASLSEFKGVCVFECMGVYMCV